MNNPLGLIRTLIVRIHNNKSQQDIDKLYAIFFGDDDIHVRLRKKYKLNFSQSDTLKEAGRRIDSLSMLDLLNHKANTTHSKKEFEAFMQSKPKGRKADMTLCSFGYKNKDTEFLYSIFLAGMQHQMDIITNPEQFQQPDLTNQPEQV